MSKLFKSYFIYALILGNIFFSCVKPERSCEGCKGNNKPPISIAGPDQLITLPTDSILLDGTASSDPDGTITEWLWTKISGPASFSITNSVVAKTVVKDLISGSYQFELKITDNGGLSAKDTMNVTVGATPPSNHPPIANAGVDQTINLPTNSITINGSGSTDPDNNITSYQWTKISGPSAFNIANANGVQTQLTNLVLGTYIFELKVTDAGGLFSRDTILVNVSPEPVIIDCNGNIRPQITTQLIPFGLLSISREGIAVVSAGNKIVYAGGYNMQDNKYSRADILDMSTNTWTIHELSQPRSNIATAVSGNKIFFAGGIMNGGFASSVVDIYDVVSNTWSTNNLPVLANRFWIDAAAATGSKVLFVSGSTSSGPPAHATYTFVDILDVVTNTWRTDTLHNRTHSWPNTSMSDAGIAATVIGNRVYLAGNGSDWWMYDGGSFSSTIDIYDASSDTWLAPSSLRLARGFLASIAVGGKNYWAGGYYKQPPNPYTTEVEIRDMNTGASAFKCLFQPNVFFSVVLKNNKLVFFTSGYDIPHHWSSNAPVMNKFDIYDISSDSWSVGVLPVNIYGSSIISVNNTIYVAGGFVNGVLSKQVYKLEF